MGRSNEFLEKIKSRSSLHWDHFFLPVGEPPTGPVAMEPRTVVYCQCGMPPEFCEFLPKEEAKKCEPWRRLHCPQHAPGAAGRPGRRGASAGEGLQCVASVNGWEGGWGGGASGAEEEGR